jgi:hypothetical protein
MREPNYWRIAGAGVAAVFLPLARLLTLDSNNAKLNRIALLLWVPGDFIGKLVIPQGFWSFWGVLYLLLAYVSNVAITWGSLLLLLKLGEVLFSRRKEQ